MNQFKSGRSRLFVLSQDTAYTNQSRLRAAFFIGDAALFRQVDANTEIGAGIADLRHVAFNGDAIGGRDVSYEDGDAPFLPGKLAPRSFRYRPRRSR